MTNTTSPPKQGKAYPNSSIHPILFYNGAFDNSLNGPGEGQDDSDQAIVIGRNRIFLHDAKECFQHAAQDCLCQIRPHCSKTGLVQGTQNKIEGQFRTQGRARHFISEKNREINKLDWSRVHCETRMMWIGKSINDCGYSMIQKFGSQTTSSHSMFI